MAKLSAVVRRVTVETIYVDVDMPPIPKGTVGTDIRVQAKKLAMDVAGRPDVGVRDVDMTMSVAGADIDLEENESFSIEGIESMNDPFVVLRSSTGPHPKGSFRSLEIEGGRIIAKESDRE